MSEAKDRIETDGICHLCKKVAENLSADPSKWRIDLTFKNGNGLTRPYHVGCLSLKLTELEQQNKELILKLEQYYNHFCDFKICGSTCKNLKCTDKAELKTFINKYK